VCDPVAHAPSEARLQRLAIERYDTSYSAHSTSIMGCARAVGGGAQVVRGRHRERRAYDRPRVGGQNDPARARRGAEQRVTRRPDLFIVGAPKSGTTSLYSYLAGHPQVYMSPVKEPLYFSPDAIDAERTRFRYPDDEQRYLSLYADARDEVRLGEASTRYLASPHAPTLVAAFQPRPYVVAILRNPVDMIYALHNETVSQGHERIADFAQALAADDMSYANERARGDVSGAAAHYRQTALYADQLERWFGAVGRDRVCVIIFDDFARDTAAELRGVLEFLDVDADYRPASLAAHNVSHRQRPLVRAALDSSAAEWLTDRALPRLIGQNAKARLALRFRHSPINRRPAPRPALQPGLRRELEIDFRPQVERLSELLKRDLVKLWFSRQ